MVLYVLLRLHFCKLWLVYLSLLDFRNLDFRIGDIYMTCIGDNSKSHYRATSFPVFYPFVSDILVSLLFRILIALSRQRSILFYPLVAISSFFIAGSKNITEYIQGLIEDNDDETHVVFCQLDILTKKEEEIIWRESAR